MYCFTFISSCFLSTLEQVQFTEQCMVCSRLNFSLSLFFFNKQFYKCTYIINQNRVISVASNYVDFYYPFFTHSRLNNHPQKEQNKTKQNKKQNKTKQKKMKQYERKKGDDSHYPFLPCQNCCYCPWIFSQFQ